MALKPLLARTDYTISSEKNYLQRLGEILHFSLSYILRNYRHLEHLSVENIVSRALLFFPFISEKSQKLFTEATKILNDILQDPSFALLLQLVEGAKGLYSEVEILSKHENRIYRPDFLIEKNDLLILLEFKLREEDFSEEQIEKYVDLLKELFGTIGIYAYLLTFIPFTLKLCKKIEPKKELHGIKGLSNTSQLSLFKELN